LSQARESISVEQLREEPYRILLSYPKVSDERVERLAREIKAAGVERVIFTGKTKVDGLNVLGKGCTAIVFAAQTVYGKAAVKVLRVDSGRGSLEGEAVFLGRVNRHGIGPKLYYSSKDFLVLEYVEGKRIWDYVMELKGRGAAGRLRRVVKAMLEQAYILDREGVAHHELSNPLKHVIVASDERPVIIDFESATENRRYSNLTSLAQSLFVGGKISPKIRRVMNIKDVDRIVSALKEYKARRDEEAFKKVLESARINF